MAKRADAKAEVAKGGTAKAAPRSATAKATPPVDPLAGKSPADRKSALTAAARSDERAARSRAVSDLPWFENPSRCATENQAKDLGLKSAGMKLPKALVVDADKKARALSILGDLARADKKVAAVRKAPGTTVKKIQAARTERAAVKRQYSTLYGEAADSCQAAEAELAAK